MSNEAADIFSDGSELVAEEVGAVPLNEEQGGELELGNKLAETYKQIALEAGRIASLAFDTSKAYAQKLRKHTLTARETEVAKLVAQGKSDKEIAQELFIAPKTVGVHLRNIYKTFGVHSRMEVILLSPIPSVTPEDRLFILSKLSTLSPRENEILHLFTSGYTRAQITAHLGTSKKTISTQVTVILQKLGVNSQEKAVALAHAVSTQDNRPDSY